MPIRAVVYASQAAEGLSIDRLKALVADAARFNKLAGVTGVLLHDGTRFVQYFEGPEDGVASVYERVLQSASHTDVVELARGRVSTRQFPIGRCTSFLPISFWSADLPGPTGHASREASPKSQAPRGESMCLLRR